MGAFNEQHTLFLLLRRPLEWFNRNQVYLLKKE